MSPTTTPVPAIKSPRPITGGANASRLSRNEEREKTAATRLRIVSACLVILTVLSVLTAVYFAKAVLMPATMALVLALVLRPIVSTLRRWRIPSAVTATVLFGLVFGGLVVATAYLAEPIQRWLANAPRTTQEVADRLHEYFEPLERLKEAQNGVDEITKSPGEQRPVPVRLEQPALTNETLNTTGSFAASVVLTSALLFLLLVSGDRFVEKTVEMVPSWRGKREVVEMVQEIERRISVYLGSITLVNAGLGLAIGLGLWFIGMPNPVLWGVMAALLNYIPFAGLIAGTCIVSVAALATFESVAHAALAPLIYLGANGVEANIITPLLLGRSIDLNPVVILLAVLLGGWLWGIAGIFLSVPLLIIAKIVCEGYEFTRPVAVYLAK